MKPGPAPNPWKENVIGLNTKGDNKPKYVLPKCPDHLNALAKKEWNRIGEFLRKYKLITDIDTAALALYCASYALWQEAEEQLKGDGEKSALLIKAPSGYPIRNPYLDIANRAKEDTYKYLQQFGLSPAARTRVTPGIQGDLFGEDKGKAYLS